MLPDKTINKLTGLYGPARVASIATSIEVLLQRHSDALASCPQAHCLSQRDVMLITYADSLTRPGQAPLRSLGSLCQQRLKGLINTVHILPFFPYSSDDGFAVIDYRSVKSSHGSWADVSALARDFNLCFDLVINHVSASSGYFKGFLADEPEYREFFIALDEHTDTSVVLRPRTLPLLHRYETAAGAKWCWTTFSADQLDLNFQNPAVLLEMLDVLLFYVAHGARLIRLDAIAYLWKQLGTSCAHLPQTHLVVQLMRDILDLAAPGILLLTETNVGHVDNISYFGDGTNEAQIVYNFPLPPLVLAALSSGDASHLTAWAGTVQPPSQRTTFLNFTASHDGIGVRPAADILDDAEMAQLVDLTIAHGGKVSCKTGPDDQAIPYELNINYFDALNDPHAAAPDSELEISRFLLSQSIALVFRGVPAIYIHSLLGSRNWVEGVAQTGQPRSINRQKLDLNQLEKELADPGSRRAQVFTRYSHMLALRAGHTAFCPGADQRILDFGPAFFAVLRQATDRSENIIAVHNVTGKSQRLSLPANLMPTHHAPGLWELISSTPVNADQQGSYRVTLPPYRFVWLRSSVVCKDKT